MKKLFLLFAISLLIALPALNTEAGDPEQEENSPKTLSVTITHNEDGLPQIFGISLKTNEENPSGQVLISPTDEDLESFEWDLYKLATRYPGVQLKSYSGTSAPVDEGTRGVAIVAKFTRDDEETEEEDSPQENEEDQEE